MGSDPFENSDVNKSRFVSLVLTAAFSWRKCVALLRCTALRSDPCAFFRMDSRVKYGTTVIPV
jgi:hypothetical protein